MLGLHSQAEHDESDHFSMACSDELLHHMQESQGQDQIRYRGSLQLTKMVASLPTSKKYCHFRVAP